MSPETKHSNNNNHQRISLGSVVDAVSVGACVPERVGRNLTSSDAVGHGKLKNAAWFAQLRARRALPWHCHRCGNPHDDATRKTCLKCRQATAVNTAKRKALKQGRAEVWDAIAEIRDELLQMGRRIRALQGLEKVLEHVQKRLDSVENCNARLEANFEKEWRVTFGRGYRAAQKAARKATTIELPTMSNQEVATMNHAYDHE